MDTNVINYLRTDIILIILVIAYTFYLLVTKTTNELIAIIIIIIIIYFAYVYISHKSIAFQKSYNNGIKNINKTVEKRKEAVSENYYINKFYKNNFIYLKKNQNLINIANDLLFLRKMDYAQFGDILLMFDKLQKVYIYILIKRYYFPSYISTFIDIRQGIIEKLYGFYLNTPKNFMHIYGLDPYTVLNKNIEEFVSITRTMINVLKNFAKQELDINYIPPTEPYASNQMLQKNSLP